MPQTVKIDGYEYYLHERNHNRKNSPIRKSFRGITGKTITQIFADYDQLALTVLVYENGYEPIGHGNIDTLKESHGNHVITVEDIDGDVDEWVWDDELNRPISYTKTDPSHPYTISLDLKRFYD